MHTSDTPTDFERKLFRIGMWWRIAYGGARTVLGLALWRAVGLPLHEVGFIRRIMEHELTDDPTDFIVSKVGPAFHHHPVPVTYFLASYFIFWGVMDMVLSYSLLRGETWAYMMSYLLITAFIVYELFRFTHTHSLVLLGVIIIDILVIWLIRREHKKLLSKRALKAEADLLP